MSAPTIQTVMNKAIELHSINRLKDVRSGIYMLQSMMIFVAPVTSEGDSDTYKAVYKALDEIQTARNGKYARELLNAFVDDCVFNDFDNYICFAR